MGKSLVFEVFLVQAPDSSNGDGYAAAAAAASGAIGSFDEHASTVSATSVNDGLKFR